MNAIVLLTEPHLTVQDLAPLISGVGERNISNDYVVVMEGDDRVYIERHDQVLDDFDMDELLLVKQHLKSFGAFVLEYNSLDLLKRILKRVLLGTTAVVDNDHGWIGSGSEFLHELSANPHWDWRRKSLS